MRHTNRALAAAALLTTTALAAPHDKLRASDGAGGDNFGNSVGVSATTAIIGAHNEEDGGFFAGAAYFFSTLTGAQISKVSPYDVAPEDNFGYTVAIGRNHAIVGTIFDDDNGNASGSAYAFVAPPCLTADINRDGVVDSSDLGTLIGQFGDQCP